MVTEITLYGQIEQKKPSQHRPSHHQTLRQRSYKSTSGSTPVTQEEESEAILDTGCPK